VTIYLTFKNSELIEMLKERGELILDEKWDKVKEVETKITEYKNKELEELRRPLSAFITFETEEGINLCLKEIKYL